MKSTIASVCALMLLSACQTPFQEGAQLGVRVKDAQAPNARIRYDQVVILDTVLQHSNNGMTSSKIAVENQGSRRTPTGTLNVIVQLRNRTGFPQVMDARVSFFDASYAPTEKPSAWNRIHLEANGIGSYQETSIATAVAAHYYVEIKEAR
jgi:hypothetical protein